MTKRLRTRYVRSDEVKFADRLPADGQNILARMSGHKSYIPGRWNAAASELAHGDCRTHLRYLTGWVPDEPR